MASATERARIAIRSRRLKQERLALHEALTAYAKEHAGTKADLDEDLERSAVDRLMVEDDGPAPSSR
jgi:hypothetical protein